MNASEELANCCVRRLTAINAVSLVFALIANIALLFNMARRLSFEIAQPITIIGWYIASRNRMRDAILPL
jgi:hypothetical protein